MYTHVYHLAQKAVEEYIMEDWYTTHSTCLRAAWQAWKRKYTYNTYLIVGRKELKPLTVYANDASRWRKTISWYANMKSFKGPVRQDVVAYTRKMERLQSHENSVIRASLDVKQVESTIFLVLE